MGWEVWGLSENNFRSTTVNHAHKGQAFWGDVFWADKLKINLFGHVYSSESKHNLYTLILRHTTYGLVLLSCLWRRCCETQQYLLPHMPKYHLRSTPEHLLAHVYEAAVNASYNHLFPTKSRRSRFPSRLLLMGVVITSCKPTGVSGLILVQNLSGPRLS